MELVVLFHEGFGFIKIIKFMLAYDLVIIHMTSMDRMNLNIVYDGHLASFCCCLCVYYSKVLPLCQPLLVLYFYNMIQRLGQLNKGPAPKV